MTTAKSMKDDKLAGEMKTHAQDLKAVYNQRDLDFKEYEKYYNMTWEDEQSSKLRRTYKVLTTSPDARNKVLGAVRLLVATDPQFQVESENLDKEQRDELETSFNRWWVQSGRAAGRPLHYDMILSAMLYGEMHTAISPVKDMLEYADKKHKPRLERVYQATPLLMESWNPKNGYPEFDRLGLAAYYREVDTTVAQVVNDFGDLVPQNIAKGNRYAKVKLKTFYDLDYCAIWADSELLWLSPHGYSEIPISVTLTDGSRIFDKPEEQRQPLLYSLLKSKLWEKQNMMLTIIYSMMFGMGANAMFKHWSINGEALNVDWSNPAGVAELTMTPDGKREDFEQVQVNPVSQAVWETYKLAEAKVSESTIYPQAMGGATERVTTFSEMSLLNQAGRLPLISTQRMGGEGIARVMELALGMMKADGEKFERNGVKINPKDMPDDLQISVKLEVNLPQDRLSLANIAATLKERNLVDDEWIQSNLLNVNNTSQMRRNIMKDQAMGALFGQFLQEKMAEIQQAQQQRQAADMGQGMPGGEQPGQPGMNQVLPPEMQQQGQIPPPDLKQLAMMQAMRQSQAQQGGMTPPSGTMPQGAPMQGGMIPPPGMAPGMEGEPEQPPVATPPGNLMAGGR